MNLLTEFLFFMAAPSNSIKSCPRKRLIYSFGVIHHTPHPERVLEQLRNYVRPGSTVKIMVYHRYSWKVLWILMTYGRFQFWKLTELVARYSEAETGCPVTYSYSKRELRHLIERSGFR